MDIRSLAFGQKSARPSNGYERLWKGHEDNPLPLCSIKAYGNHWGGPKVVADKVFFQTTSFMLLKVYGHLKTVGQMLARLTVIPPVLLIHIWPSVDIFLMRRGNEPLPNTPDIWCCPIDLWSPMIAMVFYNAAYGILQTQWSMVKEANQDLMADFPGPGPGQAFCS